MKWFANTVRTTQHIKHRIQLFSVLLLNAATLSSPAMGASAPSSNVPDAQTFYNSTLNSYVGNRQAVVNNLVLPMTSGGKITTPDGKTSFTANSLHSADTPILRVTVAPYPQTGDLQKIIVEQDLTGSGSFNYAASFPPPGQSSKMISAVCADGYIQCDPGTFSNCQYRTWSAQNDGSVIATVAGSGSPNDAGGNVGALSSCYCFNKYCSKNNSALLAVDNISSNVGGSVLAAFLNAKTGMTVSKAESAGSGVITYYGVATSSTPTGASRITPAQTADAPILSADNSAAAQLYYNDQGALGALTDSASQMQQNTPNSLFNSVRAASTKTTGTTVSCSNIVTPQLNVMQRTLSQTGGQDSSHTSCVDVKAAVVLTQSGPTSFVLGTVGETAPYTNIGNNCGGIPAIPAGLGYPAYPVDTMEFTPPSTTYGYKITGATGNITYWGGGCDNVGTGTANWTPAVGQGSPVIADTSLTCQNMPGAQFPFYKWQINVAYDSQEVAEITNLGCQQFEQDTTCTPVQETWDGRPVIVNGVLTGFTISGSQLGQVCKDLSGPVRGVHYCAPGNRPWFRQDKTFYCTNKGNPYDFSKIKDRMKGVQSSASMPTASSMTYADNGTTYTYGLPQKGALPACSQVCRTKIPDSAAPVTPTAPRTDVETAPAQVSQSFNYYFKDCVASTNGTAWTCPVDDSKGEIVVSQCGCGTDMGAAAGALDAISNATADSICSKQ